MTGDEGPAPVLVQRAVTLTDDEAKALIWAAWTGAYRLRGEGWPDMKRNADILDRAREKIETAPDA